MQSQIKTISSNSIITVESTKSEINQKSSSRRYIGILLSLLCSLTFSLSTLLVKYLQGYNPFLVGLWRFQGILWPSLILLGYTVGFKKTPIFESTLYSGNIWFLLCCRLFFSTTAILLQYLSLQYISLADSLVIIFSTPVFVSIVAHKVLGEKCGLIPLLCALLTLVGVGVICRPSIFMEQKDLFDANTLIGISFALGSMICTGIAFVLMRYLRTIHFSVMMALLGIWGTVECVLLVGWLSDSSPITTPSLFLPIGGKDTLLALALTSLSFVSQGALVLSLKFEQCSVIAVFRAADVLFGFVWQALILRVIADTYSIIGATIVLSGVLLLGIRKLLSQLPTEHKTRRRLIWLLK